ncbi:MAG: DUF2207 domain-containing protein [Propionibacteriaceae bacterium]|jgi:hypothetical protein|nr:DUF2207 domain-containing protein [Propionibacteriaceae bacterium]
MKPLRLIIVACFMIIGFSLLPASSAWADSPDRINQLTIDATVSSTGELQVIEDLSLTRSDPNASSSIALTTRGYYDQEYQRRFIYDNLTVTTIDGRRADFSTQQLTDYLLLTIKPSDAKANQPQQYRLQYTIAAVVSPDDKAAHGDEINWNAINAHGELTIGQANMTLHAPTAAESGQCFIGWPAIDKQPTTAKPCSQAVSGLASSKLVFKQGELPPGSGLTLSATWPEGSFHGAEVDLAPISQNPFGLADGGVFPAAGAGLCVVASCLGLASFYRRAAKVQAGVTPLAPRQARWMRIGGAALAVVGSAVAIGLGQWLAGMGILGIGWFTVPAVLFGLGLVTLSSFFKSRRANRAMPVADNPLDDPAMSPAEPGDQPPTTA